MNKVYQISSKISTSTLFMVVVLGISSCSTYQPSGYESDGVYYNPKTDKTYQQAHPQIDNSQDNSGEIKIGSAYFDAEGNGAEQFFYQDETDNSQKNATQQQSTSKVTVNQYGLGGLNYFGNNNYTLSYNNDSSYNWGRNDGVEINIWNNSPWMYGGWGWNNWYGNPYRFGFYDPWYGGGFGWGWNNWYGNPYRFGFYDPWYGGGFGFGFSSGWGWNRPFYGGGFGWGMNNWYGNPYYGYGGGWGWNRPRGIYTQPGQRYGNTAMSNRPVSGFSNRGQLSNGSRPTRPSGSQGQMSTRPITGQGMTRPTREARPTTNQGQMNTRPVREARPNTSQGQMNTRPVREARPNTSQGQIDNRPSMTRPTREVRPNTNQGQQRPTYNTRPTREYQQPSRSYDNNSRGNMNSRPSYSSPSPSRGSSMGSGSMGGGSRGGRR